MLSYFIRTSHAEGSNSISWNRISGQRGIDRGPDIFISTAFERQPNGNEMACLWSSLPFDMIAPHSQPFRLVQDPRLLWRKGISSPHFSS